MTGCRASCASTASACPASTRRATRWRPLPAARAEAQAALRGAIELAALLGVDTVVTMSGCPGGRGAGDSTGVFAVSWLCCDDEPLWEWQFREHVVPFWRELSAWAATAAPELRICLELHPGLTIFGADSFARLRAEVGPNIGINLDPSHFWWQGVDPLAIVEAHGDAIGFAHGKDTLLHPERIRLNGLLDARYPIDPETASWHFAAVGGGRPLEEWWDLLRRPAGRRLRRRRLDRARGPDALAGGLDRGLRRGAARGAGMAVTLNDVARRAGVSKSTVSNVVRGATPVSPVTRRRVEAAISELGYRPNEVARALKQRATRTLGLVITDTVNPFAATLAQAVVRRARRDGYAVLIADTDGDPEIEAAQCRALVSRRVDGVIFAALAEDSTSLADLLDRGVPTMLASFGGTLDRRAGAIDIDEEEAMDAVIGYLADLGHERFAFARQHAREAEVDRRPQAFSSAVRRRGLHEVALDADPTAICCMNDGVAIDLMDSLERRGLRVPEDISVAGFDDVPLASHNRIRLTTVRQDAAAMGTRAAELVLAAVNDGRHVEQRELVRGELIVRESTGPPRQA